MTQKTVTSVIILAIIGVAIAFGIYALSSNDASSSNNTGEIACPNDDSPYVWTPIGTFSENFNWRCLQCGRTWTKTYDEDVYQSWQNAFLEPDFVRDYTLLYLRTVLQMDIPDPLTLDWTGGRETPEETLGYDTYVYRTGGITVTIGYPVVRPEDTIYKIKVEVGELTIWEGQLHRREFLEPDSIQAVYEYYGGVGLFDKGIHVDATNGNPLIRQACATFEIANDYWQQLKEHVTVKASTEDFISIIISRGDKPTGGYTIQIKSFSWLESYPVRFRFAVDFTDPGEGVAVTEAITNPLVLVPIGNLSPGEYVVEVHIDQYILTFDEQGNPVYTLVETLKEEIWKQTFVIE